MCHPALAERYQMVLLPMEVGRHIFVLGSCVATLSMHLRSLSDLSLGEEYKVKVVCFATSTTLDLSVPR